MRVINKLIIFSTIFVVLSILFFYSTYDYVCSGKAAIPVKIQIINKSKNEILADFFRISPKGIKSEIEKLQKDLWVIENKYCKYIFFTLKNDNEVKIIEGIVITIGGENYKYDNKAIQGWKNKNNQYEIPKNISGNTFIGYGRLINYAGNMSVVNDVLMHSLPEFLIILIFSFFLVCFKYFNLYSNVRIFCLTSIFLGAVSVAICAPLLYLPPGRDMGWFLLDGMKLANYYMFPYIDYINFNMPGQTLLYAMVIYIFGNSVFALRLVELILLIFSAFALGLLLKQHVKFSYWMVVVIYYFLSYMSYGYYFTGERDGFVLFFIIFSLWAILNAGRNIVAKKRYVWIFAAGLFAGVIILFRSVYVIFLPFFIFFVIFKFKNIKQVLIFSLSSTVPVGLLMAILYCVDGWTALQKFYENIIVFPMQSYNNLFGGKKFSFSVVFRHLSAIKWWLFLIGFFMFSLLLIFIKKTTVDKSFHSFLKSWRNCTYYKKSKENEIIIFCFMFIVVFCCIVFIHGSFQHYHAIPLRFVIFLLCMMYMKKFLSAIDFFLENTMFVPVKRNITFSVLLIITVLFNTVIYNERTHDYSHGYMIRQNYSFVMNKNYAPDEQNYDPVIFRELGLYLNRKTEQNDKIQIWGVDGLAYFYADRPFSSNQTNPILLWVSTGNIKEKLYREYLNDLKEKPPKFFVIEKYKMSTVRRILGIAGFIKTPDIYNYVGVHEFIMNNYKLASSIEDNFYHYLIYMHT